jgi:sugar phosphate permease
MLVVYATTRATGDGWGNPVTLALFAVAAALIAAFVAIERRSAAPLLPLRIFRLRTISAANTTMALIGAVVFSEFFLLTLYLQEVLGYSAIQTGAAFAAFALTVVVFSNVAQFVVGRLGVRRVLAGGLLLMGASVVYLARLPVDGNYLRDLFPGFVVGGAGMGLSFVPVTIASLSGVDRSDAGIASGLVNTSRQIGGAVGLAAVSAIAALSTSTYADDHASATTSSPAALDHGFQTGLYVLAALAFLGALVAGGLIRPQPPRLTEVERVPNDAMPALKEAA